MGLQVLEIYLPGTANSQVESIKTGLVPRVTLYKAGETMEGS